MKKLPKLASANTDTLHRNIVRVIGRLIRPFKCTRSTRRRIILIVEKMCMTPLYSKVIIDSITKIGVTIFRESANKLSAELTKKFALVVFIYKTGKTEAVETFNLIAEIPLPAPTA